MPGKAKTFKTYDVMKSAPPGSLGAWVRVFRGTVEECRRYVDENDLAYRETRDNYIFVDVKTKTVRLGELFTAAEIAQAHNIFTNDPTNFHKRVLDAIVTPNMERINKATGQENNPDYLAYVLEYAMNAKDI